MIILIRFNIYLSTHPKSLHIGFTASDWTSGQFYYIGFRFLFVVHIVLEIIKFLLWNCSVSSNKISKNVFTNDYLLTTCQGKNVKLILNNYRLKYKSIYETTKSKVIFFWLLKIWLANINGMPLVKYCIIYHIVIIGLNT